jgi:DMSO reductase family type II enzyme heme b subunit
VKQTIKLVAAPTAIQPGAYVSAAYPDGAPPATPNAVLMVDRTAGGGWVVNLAWLCASPIDEIKSDTDRFPDAAALLVPAQADTPLMTMGYPQHPVEGMLWRADRDAPIKIVAEGFGTVVRHAPPAGWATKGSWEKGARTARFEIPNWPALAAQKRLGVAIWQGADRQRAGLKSVSADWIALTE